MGFETAKRTLNFVSKSLKGPVFIVKAVLGGTRPPLRQSPFLRHSDMGSA